MSLDLWKMAENEINTIDTMSTEDTKDMLAACFEYAKDARNLIKELESNIEGECPTCRTDYTERPRHKPTCELARLLL